MTPIRRFSLILVTALCFLALPACQSSKLEPGGSYAPAVTTVTPGPDGQSVTNTVTRIAPDLGLFLVDSSFNLTYTAIDNVFAFERENRLLLWRLSPDIKHALDAIRPEAVKVRNQYITARGAYLAAPTPAGLSVLESGLAKAQQLSSAALAVLPKALDNR